MINMKNKKIIFIMTDTQRKDMLGCYGNPDMKTPYLDKLAGEGIRFNRAYTCQPVCGPARSAIFTGMYPHSNGSWGNGLALYANVKTIGQRLSDNGIESGYIGKWHLDGSDYFGNGICPEGFNKDYWYDMRTYLYEMGVEDRVRSRFYNTNYVDGGVTSEFTYAHKCTDKAIKYLQEFEDNDYFLTVSYDEPHGPCICPEPYASLYDGYKWPKSKNCYDTLENKPAYQRYWAGENLNANRDELDISYLKPFLGCNSYVDSQIGRLLSAIDEYAPDALVVYTSDHGDMLLSHCLDSKGNGVYDEMANIPFIVRGKDLPHGVVSETPVSHISLTPTFLDYMGLQAPDPIQGESVLEMFKEPNNEKYKKPVFIEFDRFEVLHDGMGGFQPMRGIYDGRYKLAINLLDTDELYDLENDPDEMINLINDPDYADIRNNLHDQIIAMMNETRDPFRGYQWCQRRFRPDYSFEGGNWVMGYISRQVNNEGYEPHQLEYGTALEFAQKAEKLGPIDKAELSKRVDAQKKKEASENSK